MTNEDEIEALLLKITVIEGQRDTQYRCAQELADKLARVRALAGDWAAGDGHSPLDDWYATDLRDALDA